mmetsp:Transcript_23593/g.35858  ORF Transcript_23593/g.35858 Transcript_23593/m.35858 type:complete len:568 (-) Transcript_23593:25-1728(-)
MKQQHLFFSQLGSLCTCLLLHVIVMLPEASAFTFNNLSCIQITRNELKKPSHAFMAPFSDSESLDYDDDDFWEDDEDAQLFAQVSQKQQEKDLSGCTVRQFSLGYDVILTAFAGSMGFEEVTDWEYYAPSLVNNERKVTDPPPFDPNQPKRTREKSGSVVRIFRGELAGKLGSVARSKGLDKRIMLKEFSGESAIVLAKAELESCSRMQSNLCGELNERARSGEWLSSAATRYVMGRVNGSTKEDDEALLNWMDILSTKDKTGFVGVLGELNLEEFLNDEDADVRNEWYRSLKVAPPKPGSLWIAYEWVGLTTMGVMSQPALKRWSNLPPQRGVWGNMVPPPALPAFKDRARYTKAIMRASLVSVGSMHDQGITHRSISRNSIIVSSVGQDKQEASSPLATVAQRLRIKLADFGFSGRMISASSDEEFQRRARAFQLEIIAGRSTLESRSFAIAEDLHALGFVFIGLLLNSLAELPNPQYAMPSVDEDTLQRLMSDIFVKDVNEFREYCAAEPIWAKVVALLDENDGAGWKILSQLCFARESVKQNLENGQILTAEGILSSPFFNLN